MPEARHAWFGLVFYAGYCFGIVLKDTLFAYKFLTSWAIFRYILNWSRIDSCLLGVGQLEHGRKAEPSA